MNRAGLRTLSEGYKEGKLVHKQDRNHTKAGSESELQESFRRDQQHHNKHGGHGTLRQNKPGDLGTQIKHVSSVFLLSRW